MPWESLLETAERDERLVARARLGAQRARPAAVPDELHPVLRDALARAGIEQLYAHQAETLASAYETDTIVTTGTASGKSLAFNLPVLDTLAHDPSARALYLYPTKALAQDQARALHALGPQWALVKGGHLRTSSHSGSNREAKYSATGASYPGTPHFAAASRRKTTKSSMWTPHPLHCKNLLQLYHSLRKPAIVSFEKPQFMLQ